MWDQRVTALTFFARTYIIINLYGFLFMIDRHSTPEEKPKFSALSKQIGTTQFIALKHNAPMHA